jgi:hypothetical protein
MHGLVCSACHTCAPLRLLPVCRRAHESIKGILVSGAAIMLLVHAASLPGAQRRAAARAPCCRAQPV